MENDSKTIRARIEVLVNAVHNAKIVIMSQDYFKALHLKSPKIATSIGTLKVILVDGTGILGVNNGKTKVKKKRPMEDDDGFLD